MAKISLLFVFVLPLSILVGSTSYTDHHVMIRHLVTKIEEISDDAVASILNVHVGNIHAKHALQAQTNEWVHHIDSAILQLQRAIQHNHGGDGQHTLQNVAIHLAEIVLSSRQVLNGDGIQLKSKLQTHLTDVASEANRLSEVILQHHWRGQATSHGDIVMDIEHVLEELLDASLQLKLGLELQMESKQEIKDKIQQTVHNVVDTVQNLDINDEGSMHEMLHQVHELSHHLSSIVHHLILEMHHHSSEVEEVIRQVSYRIMDICSSLDQAIISHGREVSMNTLKRDLKAVLQQTGGQMEKLVWVLKSSNGIDQDVNNLMRTILAKWLSQTHILQWSMETLTEGNSD